MTDEMTRAQHDAQRQMVDLSDRLEGPHDRRNVYRLRLARDERAAKAALGYTRPRENVSNVVPIRTDLPPAAA